MMRGFIALICSVVAMPAVSQTVSQPKQPKALQNLNDARLVLLAPDSEQRFNLWLVEQSKQRSELQSAIDDLLNAQLISVAYEHTGLEPWQAHIVWSWGDMGPMEAPVLKEIQRLDQETHHNMYAFCVWPGGNIGRGGRACVMQIYACEAARNKFDDFAMKMTVATQMHNDAAVKAIWGAGAWRVAEFLRNNRGCR